MHPGRHIPRPSYEPQRDTDRDEASVRRCAARGKEISNDTEYTPTDLETDLRGIREKQAKLTRLETATGIFEDIKALGRLCMLISSSATHQLSSDASGTTYVTISWECIDLFQTLKWQRL